MADNRPKDTLGVLTGNRSQRRQHDIDAANYAKRTWECEECGHRHSLEGSHTMTGNYIPAGVCPAKLRVKRPSRKGDGWDKYSKRINDQIRLMKQLKVLEDKASIEEWTKRLEEMRERGEKFPKPY